MSLHDELLATARRLVAGAALPPTDADVRRAISTAYYALFHRLIDAAVAHLLPTHSDDQRAAIARVFEHIKIRAVCGRVVELALHPNSTSGAILSLVRVLGPVVPDELRRVAVALTSLYQRRQEADYDRNPVHNPITLASAQTAVGQVDSAFADWVALEAANRSIAQAFLVLLLTGEPKSR